MNVEAAVFDPDGVPCGSDGGAFYGHRCGRTFLYNQTITLPVWYHLRDGYPVGAAGETSWFYQGPVIDLAAGRSIDTHNGRFHFYMPFREITGLNVSWN